VKTRDLAYVALFAALTAVLGLVPAIPIGISLVILQNLGPMLAGSVLGARRGALSQLLFVALVAVGVPLLPGGGTLWTPFAGYVLAWPLAAFVIGWLTERFWSRYGLGWALLANLLGGALLIDAVGAVVWGLAGHLSPATSVVSGFLIYLPGDAAKALIAALVGVQVRRAYPLIERPAGAASAVRPGRRRDPAL
jgi:biotin transport system substrate-specific component